MSWNHRVIHYKDVGQGDYYGIHEVFYEDGDVSSHTQEAVGVTGDSLEELREVLQMMLKCLNSPVINEINEWDR